MTFKDGTPGRRTNAAYADSFFEDPGVDGNYVKIRSDARPAEITAARRAVGRVGSWRRRIFNLVVRTGDYGATSVEVASELAEQTPCPECDCQHRPPIPVNQIASRLQELREWGYLAHVESLDGPQLRTVYGRTAEVHVVTYKGRVEYDS